MKNLSTSWLIIHNAYIVCVHSMCNVHVHLSRLHIKHLFYICNNCVYIRVFSAMWNYCSIAPVSVSPAGCSVTQISEKETVTAALQQYWSSREQWKNGSISGAAERSPETVNDIYQVVICILYYVRSVSLHCNCVERVRQTCKRCLEAATMASFT